MAGLGATPSGRLTVALPPAFRSAHVLRDGKTARQLLTEQIALLDPFDRLGLDRIHLVHTARAHETADIEPRVLLAGAVKLRLNARSRISGRD